MLISKMFYKRYIIPLLILSALVPTFVFALDQPIVPIQNYSYVFYFYYDHGQIVSDRDYQYQYDVIQDVFVQENITTASPFRLEIINLKNEIYKTIALDPQKGDVKFVKGKIQVKAPYLADGQKVNFYNSQNNLVLTVDVSQSSFCNDDNVCNPNIGENSQTCPNDCKISSPLPSQSLTPAATTGQSGKSGLTKAIIYVLIGLGIIGGFWYWKKKREPKTLDLYSNLPPSNNLPPSKF